MVNTAVRVNRTWRSVGRSKNDWAELAKWCVALANRAGGVVQVGAVGTDVPHDVDLGAVFIGKIQKKLEGLLSGVSFEVQIPSEAQGAYFEICVERSLGVASTVDGLFWIWSWGGVQSLVGADVLALRQDRPGDHWETRPWGAGSITPLDLLLNGTHSQRQECPFLPRLRLRRLDSNQQVVSDDILGNAQTTIWDELELCLEICPEPFRESLRELVLNGILHRSYAQPGDVVIQLAPHFVEVESSGGWPLGSKPSQCLLGGYWRHPQLAEALAKRGFVAMRGEGLLTVFETQLRRGLGVPVLRADRRRVVVRLDFVPHNEGLAGAIQNAQEEFWLETKERITLGWVALEGPLEASMLADHLGLDYLEELAPWLGRLVEFELVSATGRGAHCLYALHDKWKPQNAKPPQDRVPLPLLMQEVLNYVLTHSLVTDTECGRHCKACYPEYRITARIVKFALNSLAAEGRISIDKTRNQWRYSP